MSEERHPMLNPGGPVKIEPWGSMQWLAEAASVAGIGMSVARMTVRPGASSPAHRHGNCDEVAHLVAGSLDFGLAERWVTMQPGDTLVIPAGTAHGTRNRGTEEAVLLLSYSAGRRHYEALEEG